jgi:branched-chain amino acid transport system permease protein
LAQVETQVLNALVLGAIYLLFSLGLTLSWGTLNVLNLAHGSIFMFSGFIAYLVGSHLRVPFIVLVVVAILVGSLCTLFLDLVAFRRIRRRTADPHQAELLMLIASVGAAAIPVAIAQNYAHDQPFGIPSYEFSVDVYHVGNLNISNIEIVILVASTVIAVSLGLSIRFTRNGRALRALAYDPEASTLMGINPNALSTWTMLLAGAMAGLAGILLEVYLGSLSPETGDAYLVKGFAVIVLGGVGSIWGAMAGAYLLATAETIVLVTTSGGWVDAICFGMIIVVLLLRPGGLVPRKRWERS